MCAHVFYRVFKYSHISGVDSENLLLSLGLELKIRLIKRIIDSENLFLATTSLVYQITTVKLPFTEPSAQR